MGSNKVGDELIDSILSEEDKEPSSFWGNSDSEEDLLDRDTFSSDDEEVNDLEEQSKLLESRREEDSGLAAEEEQSAMDDHEDLEINLKTDEGSAENLNQIRKRLENMLFVFSDFSLNRKKLEKDLSRKECLEIFISDIATLFGYSKEVVQILLDIFGPIECHQFIEASEQSRPVTIRANLLKTRMRELKQDLSARGAVVEHIGDWCPHGLHVLKSSVPIGATPQYLGGYYMLQSASSLCPVLALDVNEKDMRVIDMSAAPGGKTTHIGMLMRNTGVLVANDINKDRQKATLGNLHRMGIHNTLVVNYDGKDLPSHFSGFDRVLLDAPCSGLGVISRDPSIKVKKTMEDLENCSKDQKELILAAVDLCKVGGMIVYSTCSISIHENEDVISYVLRKRPGVVKLVETGLPAEFGVPGIKKWKGKQFPDDITKCKRFYPHVHNMDGFFIAKLEKVGNTTKANVTQKRKVEPKGKPKKMKRQRTKA